MPMDKNRHSHWLRITVIGALAPFACIANAGTAVSAPAAPSAAAPLTYADLADLADGAKLVARIEVRKLALLEPARAPGVRAGYGRFYIEGRTQAVLFGQSGLGEAVRYLVDLPLDAKGRPPAVKKSAVIVFASAATVAPGLPSDLKLVAPDAQIIADAAGEARVITLLRELHGTGAPPALGQVREAIHVAGTLAGQGETQIFLAGKSGEPIAATIAREPATPPRIAISFGEIVSDQAAVPAHDTLGWYQLACFLPATLPSSAATPGSASDQAAARDDYRALIDALGPCPRNRVLR